LSGVCTITNDGVLVSEPERLTAVPVTENFFDLLGIKPIIGRLFTAEECKFNGPPAVLLAHGFWTRRYGTDQIACKVLRQLICK
jgi:hypothetical protein